MVEMDANEHDENAANSQFATHLVGRLLEQLQLTATPIDTVGFQKMLSLMETVSDDSFDLFYGLLPPLPLSHAFHRSPTRSHRQVCTNITRIPSTHSYCSAKHSLISSAG